MNELAYAESAPPGGIYRALFEANPCPHLIVDARALVVLRANDAAAREYGYDERAALDLLPLAKLWPLPAEALQERLARPPGRWLPARHFRRDGEPVDVEISLQPVEPGDGLIALHVRNAGAQRFSTGLVDAYRRVLAMMAGGSPLASVLDTLVGAIDSLSGEMLGSLLLYDGATNCARHAAAPNLPAAYWRAIDGHPVGPSSGSWGAAMRYGRRVVSTDIATDPLWQGYREHALPWGLRACWSSPIRSRTGEILGSFAIYYREVREPGVRDLELIEAATDLAAIAIERDAAARTLRESEACLRSIVDHAPVLITLKDIEGRYILVNRRFEEALRTRAAVALGRTDRQLFAREAAEKSSANDRKVLKERRPLEAEEVLGPPGSERCCLAVKFPLLHEDGVPYAVGTIASDIAERKRAEQSLEQSREQLRALTARLQSVREEERLRISREIHDELGQLLTALRMDQSLLIESVRAEQLPGGEALAAQLESMRELVSAMLASVRRIAADLRPEALDTLGLAGALEWQAAEFARRTGVACTVSAPHSIVHLDSERATALFRIFQEALTNVARHADARHVDVTLRSGEGSVELRIADDGRGITASEAEAPTSLGILGMRERTAMLGGTMLIEGRPGAGTVLTVRLPAKA